MICCLGSFSSLLLQASWSVRRRRSATATWVPTSFPAITLPTCVLPSLQASLPSFTCFQDSTAWYAVPRGTMTSSEQRKKTDQQIGIDTPFFKQMDKPHTCIIPTVRLLLASDVPTCLPDGETKTFPLENLIPSPADGFGLLWSWTGNGIIFGGNTGVSWCALLLSFSFMWQVGLSGFGRAFYGLACDVSATGNPQNSWLSSAILSSYKSNFSLACSPCQYINIYALQIRSHFYIEINSLNSLNNWIIIYWGDSLIYYFIEEQNLEIAHKGFHEKVLFARYHFVFKHLFVSYGF